MKYKYNEKKVNCFCYNLWAKLYQVPPRRYRPPPYNFTKPQAPENVPLQNYPVLLISDGEFITCLWICCVRGNMIC